MEIFSSIQGEGLLVGCRQIFIRFAGCNLQCSYCDIPESRDPRSGILTSTIDLLRKVESLKTPDLHSIALTGGEPLLYSDFIKDFLKRVDYVALIETNGSLPHEIRKIAHLLTYASVDIKLPEYLAGEDIIEKEIQAINILIEKGVDTYLKVVVLPSTPIDYIDIIVQKLEEGVSQPSKVPIVIQPSSPLNYWVKNTPQLLKISEKIGKHFKVRLIPQVHKFLNLR